jgi:hypothetical protein
MWHSSSPSARSLSRSPSPPLPSFALQTPSPPRSLVVVAPPWVGSRSPDGWDQIPRWMVGIRSPDGLVVGSCTSHLAVLGSIPKREEPAPPWVGSRSPDGWDQIPDGLVVGLAPATLEFWVTLGSIPKREEPGKTGRHPVLKYRVPHGSHPMGWWLC